MSDYDDFDFYRTTFKIPSRQLYCLEQSVSEHSKIGSNVIIDCTAGGNLSGGVKNEGIMKKEDGDERG